MPEWDKQLDFDSTKSLICAALIRARAACAPDETGEVEVGAPKRLAEYSTAAIQLNNGCRGTEAVGAFMMWVNNQQQTSFKVRVAKQSVPCECLHVKAAQRGKVGSGHELKDGVRGKCLREGCTCTAYKEDVKKIEFRDIDIPEECLAADVDIYKADVLKGYTLNAYKLFCRTHPEEKPIGNCHSLRFSYITMLHTKMHLSEAEICKITHHHNINELITYFSKGVARATQLRIARPSEAAGQPVESQAT